MIFLALRQMLARKRQTVLILLGITLGTAIYILIAGMQLGLRSFFVERLIENDAHIKIMAHEEEITPETMTPVFFPETNASVSWLVPPYGKRNEPHLINPQAWFEKLNKSPEAVAFAEQIMIQVIVSRGAIRQSAQLTGIIPEKQKRVTRIEQYMKQGRLDQLGNTGNRLIAGTGLMKKLGAQIGNTVYLTAGQNSIPKPFKIVGSFEIGVQQVDDMVLYGSLLDVQALNGTPGRITQIAVKTEDPTLAAGIATQWAHLSYDKVQSWDQLNESILQVFRLQDFFRILISVGILAVASFGIYNVLSIIVNQKKREIAILRSLGYPPRDILILFITQGFLLGLLGAVLGLLIGFLVCIYLSGLDFPAFGPQGLTISYDPSIYIVGLFMALFSSLIAAYLPARSASHMTPMDIIRSEV